MIGVDTITITIAEVPHSISHLEREDGMAAAALAVLWGVGFCACGAS